MPDFLDNLIIRSLAGPRREAMLNPRLPSLFEAPNSDDAIPVPTAHRIVPKSPTTADQVSSNVIASKSDFRISHTTVHEQERAVQGENIEPAMEPSQTTQSKIKFPSPASTISAEPLNDQWLVNSEETQRPPTPQQQETSRDGIPLMRTDKLPPTNRAPIRFASLPDERGSTVAIRTERQATKRGLVVRRENKHSISKEQAQPIHSEPVAVSLQKENEESQPPAVKAATLLQPTIKIVESDSVAEEAVGPADLESLPTGVSSKKSTILQPVLTASRPEGNQHLEQPEGQDTQRVVEIHIGRIEVRAVPSAAPNKQPQRPAVPVSLEDYLRSRSGKKS
jgi:hypothetical protein